MAIFKTKGFLTFTRLFVLSVISTTPLLAQTLEQKTASPQRLNCVKTNTLAPFSIGYERSLSKNFSMGAYYLYVPPISVGSPESNTGYLALEHASSGFQAEARYYLSKSKAPLTGYYISSYVLYRQFDIRTDKISVIYNTRFKLQLTIPSDLTAYGISFGKQTIKKNGFSVGFALGVAYYHFSNIPAVYFESDNKFVDLVNFVSKHRSGISPSVNCTLGYAF